MSFIKIKVICYYFMLLEKEFQCDDCKKFFFPKQQGLDYHNKLVHNDEGKFVCPENGSKSSFKLDGGLKCHIRNVHQGRPI